MDDKVLRAGIRELRDNLGRRVEAAHFRSEPTIITSNGEPRAVIIAYAEWLEYRSLSRLAEG